MHVLSAAALAAAMLLTGCSRERIEGRYRAVGNPSVSYCFQEGGLWSVEVPVTVPMGVFPHGAGKKFSGNYVRKGDALELVCTSSSRQDPISGDFREEEVDVSIYNHGLLVEGRALLAVGSNGETNSLFASDLNPFGVRHLVPEEELP